MSGTRRTSPIGPSPDSGASLSAQVCPSKNLTLWIEPTNAYCFCSCQGSSSYSACLSLINVITSKRLLSSLHLQLLGQV